MGECFKRQLPQCSLPDTRKDYVPQLLKPHVHQPRHPVGQRQTYCTEREKCLRALIGRKRVHRLLVEERSAYCDELGKE